MDKAGQKYWNDSWAGTPLPQAVDPSDRGVLNSVNRRYDEIFTRVFDRPGAAGSRLLELGCAKSTWLPYFARRFDFQVTGLDYSPIGAQMARDMLVANGVSGEIVCSDLYFPPERMLGQFDVVVSFGVAEHFDDTAAYLNAAAAYLRPGGLLFTSIPNMAGLIGSLQKVVNRPVYDIHKIIEVAMLREAHEQAGLEVLECNYFMATNFYVNNLAGISTRTTRGMSYRVGLAALGRLSMLTWWLEDRLGQLPVSKTCSPYINCVARKAQPQAGRVGTAA